MVSVRIERAAAGAAARAKREGHAQAAQEQDDGSVSRVLKARAA